MVFVKKEVENKIFSGKDITKDVAKILIQERDIKITNVQPLQDGYLITGESAEDAQKIKERITKKLKQVRVEK